MVRHARVDDSADSSGLRLLRDCVDNARAATHPHLRAGLASRPIVQHADAPWSTWGKNGTGITTFMLKQWLKDYGIKPYTVKVAGRRGEGLSRQAVPGGAGPLSSAGDGGGRLPWLPWLPSSITKTMR